MTDIMPLVRIIPVRADYLCPMAISPLFRNAIRLLPLLFLLACGPGREKVQPTRETLTESVYASGILRAEGQYQVYARSTGTLSKVWVKEGDVVKKGQILFSVFSDLPRLSAENAELSAAFADVRANADRVRELEVSMEAAKKKMDLDALVVERQRKLWNEQIGTRIDLEQKELAFSNSKATYEAARLRLEELRRQLRFGSEQSRKSLSISRQSLSDFEVRSERDGQVFSILKEQGEMVNPQMPLAVVGDAGRYTLLLQVDENDIVQVQTGQQVFITMDSYKGKVFEAKVEKVNPLMNERTRTFEVEASFIQTPPVLYPNMTFEANIVLRTREKALTIPRVFLLDGDSVWVGKKEKKAVKTGLRDYQKVEVLEGLTEKDWVWHPEQ